MNRTILALLVASAGVVVQLAAQNAAPHFEVASIKPAGPPERLPAGATGFLPGGRFVVRNMAAERLLVLAFREDGSGTGLRPEQIIGAPSWLASTIYSIDAKVAGPATAERIVDPLAARLIRSLLEDRFKLQFHYEQRELPFYALLVEKADGSFGPNLKRSPLDCEATRCRSAGGD